MIYLNALEEQCLKCNGTGGIENTMWYHNWAMRNSKLQILKTKDEINIIKEAPDQPDESVFFFCRNCHGRGKILTDEGKLLIVTTISIFLP